MPDIRIHRDKLDALDACLNHTIDGVGTAAAYPDHFDDCRRIAHHLVPALKPILCR